MSDYPPYLAATDSIRKLGNKGKVCTLVLIQDVRTVVHSWQDQRRHVHTSFTSQFSDTICTI